MLPVVVLSGGLATRMRPMTEKIPKSLLEVCGRPFIFHQLSLLRRKGIREVILCLGYLGESIENYVKTERFSLDIRFSYDGEKLLGTGGAVLKAVQGINSPFFVLYGDSYLDIAYGEVADTYRQCRKRGLMTVYRNEGRWDSSNVVFQNGRLLRYSKRERAEDMRYIDYGLGVLVSGVFEQYKPGDAFDLAEVYEQLAKNGNLFGFEVYQKFYEIGSSAGLTDLEHYLREEGRQ